MIVEHDNPLERIARAFENKHSVIDRRSFVQQTVSVLCACVLAGGSGVARADDAVSADDRLRVDQITDPSSSSARGMFRFAPDLLKVEIGETIAFMNSRGEHTVHSVKTLWPAGVPEVAISNAEEALVDFPKRGIYPFRCRRHGQYGMVMLVVAGAVTTQELQDFHVLLDEARLKRREKAAFERLLQQAEEQYSV
ncbi:plastocyanin/azurin family copper-binding protein [Kiloniella sp. b19]|uniref:plastocyanin/azurin family copper-binding protein n=1 Tax=Kiloniella sp. GXU_MW_B19 TaxID=3141326 RepID=UPI0031D157E4